MEEASCWLSFRVKNVTGFVGHVDDKGALSAGRVVNVRIFPQGPTVKDPSVAVTGVVSIGPDEFVPLFSGVNGGYARGDFRDCYRYAHGLVFYLYAELAQSSHNPSATATLKPIA